MCKELLDHATCAASVENKAFLIQPLGDGHGQHGPESRVAAWVEAEAQILGVPGARGQWKSSINPLMETQYNIVVSICCSSIPELPPQNPNIILNPKPFWGTQTPELRPLNAFQRVGSGLFRMLVNVFVYCCI